MVHCMHASRAQLFNTHWSLMQRTKHPFMTDRVQPITHNSLAVPQVRQPIMIISI